MKATASARGRPRRRSLQVEETLHTTATQKQPVQPQCEIEIRPKESEHGKEALETPDPETWPRGGDHDREHKRKHHDKVDSPTPTEQPRQEFIEMAGGCGSDRDADQDQGGQDHSDERPAACQEDIPEEEAAPDPQLQAKVRPNDIVGFGRQRILASSFRKSQRSRSARTSRAANAPVSRRDASLP
jgi:hypothetical protein